MTLSQNKKQKREKKGLRSGERRRPEIQLSDKALAYMFEALGSAPNVGREGDKEPEYKGEPGAVVSPVLGQQRQEVSGSM